MVENQATFNLILVYFLKNSKTYIRFNAFAVHKETSSTIMTPAQGFSQKMPSVNRMPGFSDQFIINFDVAICL